jgi:hypothetical protein
MARAHSLCTGAWLAGEGAAVAEGNEGSADEGGSAEVGWELLHPPASGRRSQPAQRTRRLIS